MTNGDKLRQMTNEEIAEMQEPNNSGCPPKMRHRNCMEIPGNCYLCWLEWLNEAVENE